MIGIRFLSLMALPVLAGLAVGLSARRGSGRQVLRVSSVGLVLCAVALELLRTSILPRDLVDSTTVGRLFGCLDLVVAGLLIWHNRRHLGDRVSQMALGATALGIGLNALPVALVGAMPISLSAALRAGVPQHLVSPPTRGYVSSTDVPTWVRMFGDWMPVPGLEKVLSVGDVLLLLGLSAVVGLTCRWALSADETPEASPTTTMST